MPLGTVGGIQIRVDLSTAAIFALIAFGLAAWQFPAVNPHQATLTYALAAVVTTVGFFASLLAHELAHSLVARHYELTVNSITLWLFGVVFVGLALLVGTGHPARASIPGVIWWRTGDRVKATVWASRAGQVFGTICIVGGLYLFFLTRDWSWLWISLIGWFLTGAATAEAQQAVLAGRLRGIRASQIRTPDPVTVPGSMTVSEFIDDYLFRARHQSFPVTRDGTDTVCGLVTLDASSTCRPAAASQGRRTSAAIAGASTHRRLFTISTFTSTHQFRLRDSEPRRLEHASAAVDCLAAPGT